MVVTPTGRKIVFITSRPRHPDEIDSPLNTETFDLAVGEFDLNDADNTRSTGYLYPARKLVADMQGEFHYDLDDSAWPLVSVLSSKDNPACPPNIRPQHAKSAASTGRRALCAETPYSSAQMRVTSPRPYARVPYPLLSFILERMGYHTPNQTIRQPEQPDARLRVTATMNVPSNAPQPLRAPSIPRTGVPSDRSSSLGWLAEWVGYLEPQPPPVHQERPKRSEGSRRICISLPPHPR
jgi:hypothetical protein